MLLSDIKSNSRENNLNIIRLAAAISVAFAHSFVLIEGDHRAIWNGLVGSGSFGFVPVCVFFGLSGFLITQSFERRDSWLQFLEARWLRIFPGLFFSCLITTVLVSQFVKYQGWGAFLDILNWRYTFGAFFFDYSYFNGVFDSNPTHGVNGSLWTLPIEFRMYLFVLVFGIIGLVLRRWLFLVIAGALLCGGVFRVEFVTDQLFPILFRIKNYSYSYYSLPFCFVMGMITYLFREKIRLNLIACIVLLALNLAFYHWSLICISFVYASFTLGYLPGLYLRHLNFKADLSYGIYVLSFPVQQTLIFNGVRPEPHLFFVLTMACTLPLAYVSWTYFEKPAMLLRGKIRWSSASRKAARSNPQRA
jgi:peptidoglycan/LPS O-acetylase OafA/YrhL